MKKYLYGIVIASLTLFSACVKSIDKTDIGGTVVEKSTLTPIAGVIVTLTDGKQNYATTVTSQDGKFTLKNVSFDALIRCYLFCNATSLRLSSKTVHLQREIIGHKKYNLGYVYLYDKSQQAEYNNLPIFTYAGKTYKVAPPSASTYAWYDANDYCSNLELYYSDWRMPSENELYGMINIPGIAGETYWSSTHSAYGGTGGNYYKAVYFYRDDKGQLVSYYRSSHVNESYHVRPVRVVNE